MRTIINRLEHLEKQLCPRHDDGCALEELCRAIWWRDKKSFRKMHREDRLDYFIPQFGREDLRIEISDARAPLTEPMTAVGCR